jgi:hypothetical protein
VRQICRVVRSVTTIAILTIDSVDEDHYVPGAVITGRAYDWDIKSGARPFVHSD